MTEKEFLDYIWDYGCHMIHVFGNDKIEKSAHVTDGGGCHGLIMFEINGEEATAKQCAELITKYKRGKKLNKVLCLVENN